MFVGILCITHCYHSTFGSVYSRAAIIILTLVQLAAAIRVRLQFEVWQEFEEIWYLPNHFVVTLFNKIYNATTPAY